MKKIVSIVLALVMALSLCVTTTWADEPMVLAAAVTADTSWYTSAATDATAYTINDAADLLGLATLVNGGNTFEGKTIELAADINLSDIANWTPIGTEANPFKGSFDGKNKKISNLTITSTSKFVGLFGYVTLSGPDPVHTSHTIKDITLDTVNITYGSSTEYAGALAGLVEYAFLENVKATNVTINASSMTTTVEIGGLVGECGAVMVSNSGVDTVGITYSGSGLSYIGGVTSYVNGHSVYWDAGGADGNSKFTNCFADNVTINSTQSGSEMARVGGFAVGCTSYNSSVNTYEGCRVTNVNIICAGDGQQLVGGFMAYNTGMGSDSNCTATGSITSTGTNPNSEFGGFAGHQGGRGRTHSGHTVDVDINVANGYAGGFVGKTVQYLGAATHANHYVFENCTANGDVTSTAGTAGGFAGENGCYGGDGHQVWVDYTNCVANGDVSGSTAAGFLGSVANNSADFTDSGRTGVTLTNCKANGAVVGTANAAGLVGDVGNKNPNNDISTPVTIDQNTTAAPTVVGTSSTTNVSEDIIENTTNSDPSAVINNSTATNTTTIQGDNVTVDKNTGSVNAPAGSQVNGTATDTEKVFDLATGQEVVAQAPVETPAHSHTRRQPTTTTTDTTTDTTKSDVVTSAKTFDAGIAVYAAMGVLSLTGSAWVVGKKRG